MYEVKGLKDFGTWLRKGQICYCNDSIAIDLFQKGYLEPLKYHFIKAQGRWDAEKTLLKLSRLQKIISMKIKAYKINLAVKD